MSPSPNPRQFAEPQPNVYLWVHRVLVWGMGISTVLYALGVIRALIHPVQIPLDTPFSPSLGAALAGLLRLDPASLMLAATVVLILTPVARVVVSMVVFWRDRDRRFVLVTGAVLAIIVLTVVLGRLGLH